MLSAYRVLDLTDDRGHMAGLVLAQLGADVILVEPPGGHRTRRRGPFIDDVEGLDRSIEFHAFNRGKRSVVVESADQLAELARSADAIIDCGSLAHVLAVDLAALRAADPGLVTASISAFGGTGPKANWAATDLTVVASSGTMSLTGDRDRPPLRIGPPQAWLNAGADTAGAVLIALHERRRSGLGQHVDTSAQQSFADCTQFQLMSALVGKEVPNRLPGAVKMGDYVIPWVYECADGHVTMTFLFGPMIGPYSTRMIQWLHDEGFASDRLRDTDWIGLAGAILEGRETMATYDEATQALKTFARTKTKAELLERALATNLLIAPITTTADVLALEQLAARDYWDHVTVPGAQGPRAVRFPGPMARFSDHPVTPLAAAPPLGAHTDEVLGSPLVRPAPAQAAARTATAVGGDQRALADVKVLDFMWAVAGPAATRVLADHGACVVKIESESKPDVLRGAHPFIGQEGHAENALQFHSLNAGKLDLCLDLSVAEARDVVLDLVRWADVVTESFSPKAMSAWGLGYDDLRKVNPDVIMLSSCLMGQTGPMRRYAGFGTMAAAIAGFYPVTGWPDRGPAGPFTAYTDYISPRFTVAAILAALEHRDRTGRGQYIDFAQLEGALHYLAPQLLDQEINGRTAGRHGNADAVMAPHAVYPAAGADRWVAIACESDRHWAALADLIGAPDLAGLSVVERRARSGELDDLVSRWTTPLDAEHVQKLLQHAGVPAHMVATGHDLPVDPQLVHREHYRQVPHPNHGLSWVEGGNYTLSRTPPRVDWAGPAFGQHNSEVLQNILGYDDDRVTELVIAGAIG